METIENIMLVSRLVNWHLPIREYDEIMKIAARQNGLNPKKVRDFTKIIDVINRSVNVN